jgi:hypothetical protein
MFAMHRQKRNFVVTGTDSKFHTVLLEDLLTGLRIQVPYGPRELENAELTAEYELHLTYQDGSEQYVNLLIQGF